MLPIFHCLTGCDSTASFSGWDRQKESFRSTPGKEKRIPLVLAELGESNS